MLPVGEDPQHADPEKLRAARLEVFAARPLEFAAVQKILERHAATSLGLRALRELAPREDADARAALARAAEMIQAARSGEVPPLAGISDPMPALLQARRAARALDEDRLVALRAFLAATALVAEWLCARAAELPANAALAQGLPDFSALLERIDATVDERGRVRDHASPLLRRLRKESADLARTIERAVRDLCARAEIKAVLSDPNPVRRGGRSVLAVKAKSSGRVPGIVHDRSQSGESVFVEPREIVLPGNRLAEHEADERREVERILLELSRAILAAEVPIGAAAARIGELELALIGARYARETRLSVPVETSSERSVAVRARGEAAPDLSARIPATSAEHGPAASLLLRSTRHPLLVEEQRLGRLAEVVPLDLRLGADFDLLILTGPNTGGKTLALKTAGLCALMVRCGLPIPCADGSTVPLYDGIVADIGDEQEISQSLSTFSSHLVRIKAGLERATPRTLVLLDELGGGTDPDEGAALSEAILERFLERRVPTLASTHIGKLKEFAFRHSRAENASVEFDTVTLAPRYRILVGTPGESGALVIARRLGLGKRLVERAQERLVRRDAELVQLMADVRIARTQAEKVRSEAETRLGDVARAHEEIEAKQAAIDRRGVLLEAEAQKGIEDRVREARKMLATSFALLDQLPSASKKDLEELLLRLDDELSGTALSDRRQAFLDSLSKGSYVYLPRYKQRVAVQKVDRAGRAVTVQLGRMKMKVSFDEVASYDER